MKDGDQNTNNNTPQGIEYAVPQLGDKRSILLTKLGRCGNNVINTLLTIEPPQMSPTKYLKCLRQNTSNVSDKIPQISPIKIIKYI